MRDATERRADGISKHFATFGDLFEIVRPIPELDIALQCYA